MSSRLRHYKPRLLPVVSLPVSHDLSSCSMYVLKRSSSGWSLYSTAFAGQTPCYMDPPTPLVPRTAASATNRASISVINTKLFTLQYPLKTTKRGLSAGAKAGIAIGTVIGALAAIALLLFLIRKRRATKRKLSANPVDEPVEPEKRQSTLSQIHAPLGHISELPSPGPTDQRDMGLPSPQGPSMMMVPATPASAPASPPVPLAEMPGDTFINQYHPAHISRSMDDEFPSPTISALQDGPGIPGRVVSPLSDRSGTPAPAPVGVGVGVGVGLQSN